LRALPLRKLASAIALTDGRRAILIWHVMDWLFNGLLLLFI
jgi:hypothetical protein